LGFKAEGLRLRVWVRVPGSRIRVFWLEDLGFISLGLRVQGFCFLDLGDRVGGSGY